MAYCGGICSYWTLGGGEKTKPDAHVYCGPGLWFNPETSRIHCRLAHTKLPGLGENNYTGETDPRIAYTDGDGITDGVEDSNGNGVFDVGETDPRNPDTDGDGIRDGAEDSNRNGVVDPGETDPRIADSDGDGLNDGVEDANRNGTFDAGAPFGISHGTIQNSANSSAWADVDGDGDLDLAVASDGKVLI